MTYCLLGMSCPSLAMSSSLFRCSFLLLGVVEWCGCWPWKEAGNLGRWLWDDTHMLHTVFIWQLHHCDIDMCHSYVMRWDAAAWIRLLPLHTAWQACICGFNKHFCRHSTNGASYNIMLHVFCYAFNVELYPYEIIMLCH